MAEARFQLSGTVDGVAIFDAETGHNVGGPFGSPIVAAEEADALERSTASEELAEEVEADGWNGLAREIREGLPLDTAVSRLADIDQRDGDAAAVIEEARDALAARSDERRRWTG